MNRPEGDSIVLPYEPKPWRVILNKAQIPEIRRKLSLGQTHASIGAEYGVSRETIRLIAIGRTWKSS